MNARPTLLAVSVLALSIAGCSKGPSASDAKDAVSTELGNCSRIEIKDFEKVNGVAQGDAAYQVSVSYTLQINPPGSGGETADDFTTKAKDFDQRIQQAKQAVDAAQKAAFDYQHIPHDSSWRPSEADLDQGTKLSQDLMQKEQALQGLTNDRLAMWAEPSQTLNKECPSIPGDTGAIITKGAHEFDVAHPGQSAYLAGFMVSLTDTLNMVKTDNGWKAGL